eukprot:scaffold270781_cov31-Tisochrysis_lutea.AAC.1
MKTSLCGRTEPESIPACLRRRIGSACSIDLGLRPTRNKGGRGVGHDEPCASKVPGTPAGQ